MNKTKQVIYNQFSMEPKKNKKMNLVDLIYQLLDMIFSLLTQIKQINRIQLQVSNLLKMLE